MPLPMIVLFCIPKAVKDLGARLFWRCLVSTVVMLAFGYLCVQRIVNPWIGLAIGMARWDSS